MRRWVGATLAVCCTAMAGCSGSSSPQATTPPSTVFVTLSAARAPAMGAPPLVYTIPQRIVRPLHLPEIQAGQPCPMSPEHEVNFPANTPGGGFGGRSLGSSGPVHPIIAVPHAASGAALAYGAGGWYAAKTLWYARRTYQGPVLIRGERLDGPGSVTFGAGHTLGFLADTGTTSGPNTGMRSWPGATWVRSPGCYGFQVDGTGFSYVLVVAIRAAQPR